jgi:SAM-dependent methyltransferase
VLAVDVLAFVCASLPAPPARVLEVGAGDGELAGALRGLGYDVLAIDPASEAAGVLPVALHELSEADASFDAAVAVLSLHHVDPLAESCRRLAALLRPGGPLVIDEFDVERYDERAASWWSHQHAAAGGEPSAEPADLVARHRAHLHSLSRLREELTPDFALGEPVRGAYLYRWGVGKDVRSAEEDRIAARALPATGARLVGVRLSAPGRAASARGGGARARP